jgi:hypothetical protein
MWRFLLIIALFAGRLFVWSQINAGFSRCYQANRAWASTSLVSTNVCLNAGQSAACPNPSPEAKRGGDRKRKKSLCVVFHAVLQYA